MSNIFSVFNPFPSRDLPASEVDCLPCTLVHSAFAICGGYLLSFFSELPFKEGKENKIDFKKHPLWWQRPVRGIAGVMIGFGAYRFAQAGKIMYKKKFE